MSSALEKAIGARLATPGIFTRTFMLGIVGSLAAYLTSWENHDRLRDNYLEKHRDSGDTFDFIVVGGGTAGLILANRLSEKYKTLVLEAGGEPHPFQAVPLLSNYLLNYGEIDWRHITMPQKQGFLGSIQSRASISQGRGLGGTSNLDYMMYLRGHPHDYDNWADITEDDSWSYKFVVKYFKSLEEYHGPWQGENHGGSGPMKIRQPSFTGLGIQFCHAAQQNGYKHTDLNDVFNEGCDILTYPSKKGYRDSVYSSFYKPIKDRSNLVVRKYAHVNKVLTRNVNGNVAIGVEYDRHGVARVAYAKKEIIITAGAIQTPKILMLSGIGPKSDLASLGIPMTVDLPVGTNLQDHPSVFVGPFFVERGKSLDIDRDVSASAVLSLGKDKGPLTTTGFQAAAVVSSGLEKLHGSRNWPDLQLTMYGLSHHKSADEDFSHAFKLKKDLLQSYFEHSKSQDSFSVLVSVGRPKSTGAVKLLNRNPYAPLIINPNYFDKIYDVVVMVDGVKKALRLVENSTVFHNELHTRFTQKVLPGCEKFRFRSDAYFECYVRTLTISLGNVAGTAPLGSVLDSKMRVKGVKGLRVMDASVMPSIVTTSTGGAVMMIAEKGADLLLKEWDGTGSEIVEGDDAKNSVNVKLQENQLKQGVESSKALLAALKFKPPTQTSKPLPSLKQFNLADLASLLDPVKAQASSPIKNIYTGSFELGVGNNSRINKTATQSPLDAMRTLAPILKSQLGGLYKHYFEDSIPGTSESKGENIPKLSSTVTKDMISKLVSSLKIPILSGKNMSSIGTSLTNSLDPFKVIEGMIDKNMKDLEELEHIDKIKGISSGKINPVEKKPDNLTLDDVFGIAEGFQDELEEYEEQDAAIVLSSTSTQKPIKVVRANTTTIVSSIAVKTNTSTSKSPYIDYSYEVLPVPLTKSKGVETTISSSLSGPISVKPQVSFTKPVYAKLNTTILQTFPVKIESVPVPVQSTSAPISTTSVPKPTPPRIPVKSQGVDWKKLKNLEALAQIQHDTLAKLKHIQSIRANRPRPNPFNFHQFPPLRQHALPSFAQRPQALQPIRPPALDILPPSVRGRFPPPQYFQKPLGPPPPPPPPPLHPVYDQLLQSSPPHHNRFLPANLGGPLRSQQQQQQQQQPPQFATSAVDPSDLKYAVGSIMNAKYTHPTINPFTGILNFLGGQPAKQASESEASQVLKALQLRANVDKYIHLPSSYRPNPISITHRPTPPPPTMPPTQPPRPPPLGLEDFQKDDGIFAPLKDVLEPFTNFMKGPLNLIPNPFKSESSSSSLTSSITSSIAGSLLPESFTSGLAGSLLPSIFQQRTGPMSGAESSESPQAGSLLERRPQTLPGITRNSLATALPRFFMNASKLSSDIPQEIFLLALANLTTGLPKPFVLEPSKSFSFSSTSNQKDERNKKLLDESISDILSHLNNHHLASVSTNSETGGEEEAEDSLRTGSGLGINSANEILNIDYTRLPATVKASVAPASPTPKTKMNPPVEFHKSPWAKEPSIPTKSLHFKIKIV